VIGSTPTIVGQPVKRIEDERLLMGRGKFVDDLRLSGTLHAAILRSPEAHARIRSIDVTAAAALDGVTAVVTAADAPELRRSMPLFVPHDQLRPAMFSPLAEAIVRFVGEPVAVVLATSRYLAEDALDLIDVDYEPLDPVVEVHAALDDRSPLVHERLGSNLAARLDYRIGVADAAMATADEVFRASLSIGRCSGHPMETRGLIATHEPVSGQLTVWDSTQTPHLAQRGICEMLGMRLENVRVIAPDVGGGFGPKGILYPEEILVPYLARRFGRPVKWIEDRREHFLSGFQEREQVHEAEIGLTHDGRIVAIRDVYFADQGAYTPWGIVVPMLTTIAMPGPYRVPNLRNEINVVYTNKVPMAPYRGAGRPQAVFVMERLLEIAARGLGLDPAELRRRNMIEANEFPYDVGMRGRDGTSVVYDSGDYHACLDRALELADYDAFRAQQRDAASSGRHLGIGIASYVEATGLGPYEGAVVRVEPDGGVTVATGTGSHGQGHATVFAQIAADALSVDYRSVRVTTGDTGAIPFGIGTFASRSSVVAGNATRVAAGEVADQIKAVAATLLEAAPGDLELRDGNAQVAGSPDRSIPIAEIARAAYGPVPGATMSGEIRPILEATHYFKPEGPTYANGTHIATVEVIPDTGEVRVLRYVIVHDCGRLLNPLLVDGQIIGGLAQGIGNALFEELVYDEYGQPLTTSFVDYVLPSATEMPAEVRLEHLESPSPRNPLGIKGAGEAGTIPAPAVIANAVEDALRSYGVRIERTPIHPSHLSSLLVEASARNRDAAG
jgi:aerobic carbon-monoxide dehydrogenase large subunit